MSEAPGDETALLDIIAQASREACLEFMLARTQADRRKLYLPTLREYKRLEKEAALGHGKQSGRAANTSSQQLEILGVALLCSATGAELKKLGLRIIPKGDFIVAVIAGLKPDWLDGWAEALIESEPHAFYVLRHLHLNKLCPKPRHENYILGMMFAMANTGRWSDGPMEREQGLADRLRQAPDIPEEDIWRLFEVEGGGELSLAAIDKYQRPDCRWADALLRLSAEGQVDRQRLLSASLAALEKDFAQFRAGWFSRFHEALEPDLNERIRLRDCYLRLLASKTPPTVSFALKASKILDQAGELPERALLDAIAPVLRSTAKATVIAAVQLLDSASKRDVSLAPEVIGLAIPGFIHPAAEVQGRLLNLLERLAPSLNDKAKCELAEYETGIASSLRERFTALSRGPGRVIGQVAHPNSAPTSAAGPDSSPSVEPEAVLAIASFEELNLELLKLLEDPSDPIRLERALSGLCHFGASVPEPRDKQLGPLARRATQIVQRLPSDGLLFQLALLLQAYALNSKLAKPRLAQDEGIVMAIGLWGRKASQQGFEIAFASRNAWILQQVQAGRACALLSLPSDRRGFVAAAQLLHRLKELEAQKIAPDPVDLSLALMRLAPEGREAVLNNIEPHDEYRAALAFALGGDVTPGRRDWLWVAAAAARLPYTDQQAVARLSGRGHPDAGVVADYSLGFYTHHGHTLLRVSVEPRIGKPVPDSHLPCLFHLATAGDVNQLVCGTHVNMIRWSALVWPLQLEAFFSQGLLCIDHDQVLANSPYAGFLEPMLDAHAKIGPMGAALLVLGMACVDPSLKGLALDATIAAVAEDRLDSSRFAAALHRFIPSGYVPVKRWQGPLLELSGISARHAAFTREALAGMLRHDPLEPPRNLAALLELLYELQVATGEPLADKQTIAYLSGIEAGGKLGRAAKNLLAL